MVYGLDNLSKEEFSFLLIYSSIRELFKISPQAGRSAIFSNKIKFILSLYHIHELYNIWMF